jgi:c-di-GMP-binding flagellar brake protein YcgR
MRQFIRHPIDVPVEIGMGESGPNSAFHTHDISAGGLAIRSDRAVDPGTIVQVRIACVQPPFQVRARVAWCGRHEIGGYELGVSFLDAEDAFRARMVEQLCHIEDYRLSVLRAEGRELAPEQAAAEWIEKFASHFPEIGASRMH